MYVVNFTTKRGAGTSRFRKSGEEGAREQWAPGSTEEGRKGGMEEEEEGMVARGMSRRRAKEEVMKMLQFVWKDEEEAVKEIREIREGKGDSKIGEMEG